jgi:predicted small metal-binding protein
VAYVINCDCGYVAKGETEDELLSVAEAHIRDAHPDLVGKVTREDLLAQAKQA